MVSDAVLRAVSLLVLVISIGYYVTGSPLWGYQTRWTSTRYLYFRAVEGMRNFTEHELAQYTGANGSPIYLAVDGMVFDVSSRPDNYGPLGAYSFFSGRDAARAYATGCFKQDLTHDLRGLDEKHLKAVEGWQKFFANHINYWQIGHVEHPPLTGPVPELCEGAKRPF